MEKKITSYKELEVWKLGKKVAIDIYNLTEDFPKSQSYTLTSQMQRAAISIPSNIAEGRSRNNIKEFIQFLYIAQGSKLELETQLMIAQEVKLGTNNVENILKELDILGRMLNKMILALKQKAISQKQQAKG